MYSTTDKSRLIFIYILSYPMNPFALDSSFWGPMKVPITKSAIATRRIARRASWVCKHTDNDKGNEKTNNAFFSTSQNQLHKTKVNHNTFTIKILTEWMKLMMKWIRSKPKGHINQKNLPENGWDFLSKISTSVQTTVCVAILDYWCRPH